MQRAVRLKQLLLLCRQRDSDACTTAEHTGGGRDIKLENALLDRNKRLLKITDFGYAKTAQDSLPKSEVGTPNYAAPEVISGSQKPYDGASAVASLPVGCTAILQKSRSAERQAVLQARRQTCGAAASCCTSCSST